MIGMFVLGGGELVLILLMLLLFSLGVLSFIFWIWMLIDCIKNESIVGNGKVVWVLVIALTHWVGALIYFFAGRGNA